MLTRLRLENFKSWMDTGDIALKPITGFFGPNSSGKTSLYQGLLMMKQTDDSPDLGSVFHFGDEKTPVDLGDFESVVYGHDTTQNLKISLAWKSRTPFSMPDAYPKGGIIFEGSDIGFEVKSREGDIGTGKSLILEEMAYLIADQRVGMLHYPGQSDYFLTPPLPTGSRLRSFGDIFKTPSYPSPSKFYSFPNLANWEYSDHNFFFRSLEHEMQSLLRDLYYLGPLRTSPRRTYTRSRVQPSDVGTDGGFLVDALLSSRERGQLKQWAANPRKLAIDEYAAAWLKRLGLVHDFRVEALAEGKRVFEVKVRKSPQSAEVLLTDVGFGVSQIVPVLALCFYVPQHSTVILEQPDIHLHPSAQAGLADVFIDTWKNHNVQVLFESHSEHLLRRLQRRIAEEEIQKDDVGLYFCSADDSGGSSVSQLEVDQYGNISNWPKDFFGDQFGEIAAMSEAALKRQGDST